jgi:hypothetical protein
MSEETEFESDGHQYRISKLSALQQFHLSRKIAPLIPPLIPVFLQFSQEEKDAGAIVNLLQPFADGLAAMPDDAAESVLMVCMSALKRKADVGDLFVPVWNGRVAMFADLNDVSKVFPLAMRVIQDSLGPFIQGLLIAQRGTTN